MRHISDGIFKLTLSKLGRILAICFKTFEHTDYFCGRCLGLCASFGYVYEARQRGNRLYYSVGSAEDVS